MAEEFCGAKTRSGEPCKNYAMANGRCRMHGGKNTGAPANNSNALKHGFYSDAITPEERVVWERIELGSVDDEIKLMRVKLHRLVRLSGSADLAELIDSALEVAKKRDTNPKIGEFEKSEIKVKVPQYADLIIQAIGEIRKLELQRLQMMLMEQQIENGDPGGAGGHAVEGFEVVPYVE